MPWIWAVFSSLQQQALLDPLLRLHASSRGSAHRVSVWLCLVLSYDFLKSRIRAVEAVPAREGAVFLNGDSLLRTYVEA